MEHSFSHVGIQEGKTGEIVRRIRASKKKYLMFGAGRVAKRLLQVLDNDQIVAFIDNKKAGGTLAGKEILSLAEAKQRYPQVQILLSLKDKIIMREMEAQLQAEGLSYLTLEEFYLSFLRDCKCGGSSYYRSHQSEIDYMIDHQRVGTMAAPFYEAYADAEFPYQKEEDGLVSFLRNGKKVYLPDDIYVDLSSYIRMLFAEQDAKSPHAYFSKKHFVSPDDTFVDVGGGRSDDLSGCTRSSEKHRHFRSRPCLAESLEKNIRRCS